MSIASSFVHIATLEESDTVEEEELSNDMDVDIIKEEEEKKEKCSKSDTVLKEKKKTKVTSQKKQ